MLKKILSILFMIIVPLSVANAKNFTLNIIHMNDIHSHLDEEAMKLTFDGISVKVDAGGYPRIATVIKDKIKRYKHFVLLNAGDALQGTLYYTIFKGKVDAKIMNTLPWDAFELGNHEFDDGDANLKSFLDSINVPVIAANVYADKNDVLFGKWKPYIIKHFSDTEVGIIGIDTLATKYGSNPSKHIHFSNEIKTVKKEIKKLKSLGVNKIIVLSHYGYSNDLKLALTLNGIDVIVGGHSHTLMGDYSSLGLHGSIAYPTKIVSPNGDKTCIVQAYAYCKIVGDLRVVFDDSGKVISCKGTPLLAISDDFKIKNSKGRYEDISAAFRQKIEKEIKNRDDIEIVKKDAFVQKILEKYKKLVDKKSTEIIGYTPKKLFNIRIPGESYGINSKINLPLGSEVTPIVAKAFYERVKNSDAVILNAGGVRTNIQKGGISIKDAYTLLPFSNTLYSFSMSGAQIHKVLEDALNSVINHHSSGAFPYAYGLKYDIDMRKTRGNRIENLEILNKKSHKFQKIKQTKIYNITTISYLASGKDGYSTFALLKGKDTYFDYADSFVVYIENLSKKHEKLKRLPLEEHCIKNYIKADFG